MGRVISFCNQCTAAGKTASCVNLAASLASRGERVLVIDAAPNGRATKWLGLEKFGYSLYDVLFEGEEIGACAEETACGAVLVPSDGRLLHAEQELIYRDGRERVLKAALDGVRGQYGYVLIDCPSSAGLLTVNALAASDTAVIPVPCEGGENGVRGTKELLSLVGRHLNGDLKIGGALLTMFDSRAAAAKASAEEAKAAFGRTYATVIPRSARLAESAEGGMPAIAYDAKCLGARAYEALSDEILREEGRGG